LSGAGLGRAVPVRRPGQPRGLAGSLLMGRACTRRTGPSALPSGSAAPGGWQPTTATPRTVAPGLSISAGVSLWPARRKRAADWNRPGFCDRRRDGATEEPSGRSGYRSQTDGPDGLVRWCRAFGKGAGRGSDEAAGAADCGLPMAPWSPAAGPGGRAMAGGKAPAIRLIRGTARRFRIARQSDRGSVGRRAKPIRGGGAGLVRSLGLGKWTAPRLLQGAVAPVRGDPRPDLAPSRPETSACLRGAFRGDRWIRRFPDAGWDSRRRAPRTRANRSRSGPGLRIRWRARKQPGSGCQAAGRSRASVSDRRRFSTESRCVAADRNHRWARCRGRERAPLDGRKFQGCLAREMHWPIDQKRRPLLQLCARNRAAWPGACGWGELVACLIEGRALPLGAASWRQSSIREDSACGRVGPRFSTMT